MREGKLCPDCGGVLKYDDELDWYICQGCGGEFDPEEIEDEDDDVVVDEADDGDEEE